MEGKMIKLINNYEIPVMGYGSSIVNNDISGLKAILRECRIYSKSKRQHKLNVSLPKCVDYAMNNSINMFDTSSAYGASETVIGKTLQKYKREDYFVVTKLCNGSQYEGNIRKAFEESLKHLKVDYVDLYLMHWPVADYFKDSWKELEKLYDEKLCKAIGVCNFDINHLEELETVANIMPMTNQIECHPLFTQEKLRKYCKEKEIGRASCRERV